MNWTGCAAHGDAVLAQPVELILVVWPGCEPGGSQPGNGAPAAPGSDRYRDMLAGLMR